MSDQSIGSQISSGSSGGVENVSGVVVPNFVIPGFTPFAYESSSVSNASPNQLNAIDSSSPRLQQPTYEEVYMTFKLGMAAIVTEMLTKWNTTLQEESQRIKEEMNSPAYRNWEEQHSSNYLAKVEASKGKETIDPAKNAHEMQVSLTTNSFEQKNALAAHHIGESNPYAGLADRYNQVSGLSNLLSTTVQNMESTRSSVSNTENGAINVTKASPGPDLTGYSPASSMAVSLAIGAGFIASFSQVPNTSSTSQIEVKPIQDAWNNINPSSDQLTQNGGWFSAMWSIGLIYQLSAQNIAELGTGFEKGPHKDLEFAKSYAQNLINSLDGNGFNASLLALLTPMLTKAEGANIRQSPEMIAIKGKIILLALALALVYKLELKSLDPNAQIDEATFAAMLKGNVDFSRNDTFGTADLKRQLVLNFQANLALLPASERAEVIEGILAYISKATSNNEPGVEGLLDQQTAFENVLTGGTVNTSIGKPIEA